MEKESQQVAEQYLAQAQVFSLMNNFKESDNAYRKSIFLNDKISKETDYSRPDVDDYMCFLIRNYSFDSGKWDNFDSKRSQPEDKSPSPDVFVRSKSIKIYRPDIPPKKSTLNRIIIIPIRVSIDEKGNIERARAVCGGNQMLTEASLKAAYKSRFSPALKNGTAIKGSGLIIYDLKD